MEILLRGCALAMVAAMTALFLRKYDGVFAALLTLACVSILFWMLASLFAPILSFLDRLREAAGIAPPVMAPLLKAVGIGLLVQAASAVCADAGNQTLASAVHLLGTAASIYVALPLLEAVLEVVVSMLGE